MALEPIAGSVWESWQMTGKPFGIERIDNHCYFNFRLFGSRRVYLDREASYSSRENALKVLSSHIVKYEQSIIYATL